LSIHFRRFERASQPIRFRQFSLLPQTGVDNNAAQRKRQAGSQLEFVFSGDRSFGKESAWESAAALAV
jgi:hypothetical protein